MNNTIDDYEILGTIAFRHLVEDAINCLETTNGFDDRQRNVLRSLEGRLQEAIQGSQLARENKAFADSSRRRVFESYSEMNKYLYPKYEDQWSNHVASVQKVLRKLREGEPISQHDYNEAREVLAELHKALNCKRSRNFLGEPEEIWW